MDIKTKLNIGDKFFCIGYNTYTGKEKCLACDGEGIVYYKDNSSGECPRCYGKGHHETYGKENWHVLNDDEEGVTYGRPVGKISIIVEGGKRKQDVEIAYSMKNMGHYYYEDDCFITIEDAECECKKRNSENNHNL